ncbi:MAG: hypothetical protein KDD44_03975 [Bdellovibrionales bacterium]|nr:hypothetical protein [Bdellovibrionales bacterium]
MTDLQLARTRTIRVRAGQYQLAAALTRCGLPLLPDSCGIRQFQAAATAIAMVNGSDLVDPCELQRGLGRLYGGGPNLYRLPNRISRLLMVSNGIHRVVITPSTQPDQVLLAVDFLTQPTGDRLTTRERLVRALLYSIMPITSEMSCWPPGADRRTTRPTPHPCYRTEEWKLRQIDTGRFVVDGMEPPDEGIILW